MLKADWTSRLGVSILVLALLPAPFISYGIAYAEVQAGSPEKAPSNSDTEMQCRNPAEKVRGTCPSGSVPARSIANIPDQRCVPDPHCGSVQTVSVDCSDNDADRCKPCTTSCNACSIYTMSFATASDNFYGYDLPFNQAFPPLSKNAPSCLKNIRAHSYNAYLSGVGYYKDDTMFAYVISQMGAAAAFYRPITKSNQVPEFNCSRVCNYGAQYCNHYLDHCISGVFAFDGACNFVDMRKVSTSGCAMTKIASSMVFQPSSPISLLWSKDSAVENSLSFVQFPLNMQGHDKWYTWHGSADTPLLVYDPRHTREVTSPTQLFGNWTFGGKQTAMNIDSKLQDGLPGELLKGLPVGGTDVLGTPWENGYEALAVLDRDHNGKIEGEERESLALWFDKNQDAVSQPGELVALADSGVSTLFLGPTKVDPLSKNVELAKGFLRKDGDEVYQGGTVDWYSEGGASQGDLLALQTLRSLKTQAITLPRDPTNNRTAANPATADLAKRKSDSQVAGLWEWHPVPASEGDRHGWLAIDEYEDGTVNVVSFTELPVRDPAHSVGSYVNFKVSSGKIQLADGKTPQIHLKSLDGGDQASSNSTVISLNATTQMLEGITAEKFPNGKKTLSVNYHWEASLLQKNPEERPSTHGKK